MTDIIIVVILVVIVGAAAWYIYKAKKSGKKCIGCPDGGSCSSSGSGCGCGCGCGGEELAVEETDAAEETCSCGCCGQSDEDK